MKRYHIHTHSVKLGDSLVAPRKISKKCNLRKLLFFFPPTFLFSGSAPVSQTVDGFSATNLTAGPLVQSIWAGSAP